MNHFEFEELRKLPDKRIEGDITHTGSLILPEV